MITLNELHTLAKRFVQTHHGVRPPQPMHPLREWKIGLSIFGLLVISSGVFSYVQYQSYDIHGVVEGDMSATIVPYRAALVEEALQMYERQKAQHQAVVNSVPVLTSETLAVESPAVPTVVDDSTLGVGSTTPDNAGASEETRQSE